MKTLLSLVPVVLFTMQLSAFEDTPSNRARGPNPTATFAPEISCLVTTKMDKGIKTILINPNLQEASQSQDLTKISRDLLGEHSYTPNKWDLDSLVEENYSDQIKVYLPSSELSKKIQRSQVRGRSTRTITIFHDDPNGYKTREELVYAEPIANLERPLSCRRFLLANSRVTKPETQLTESQRRLMAARKAMQDARQKLYEAEQELSDAQIPEALPQ